MEQVYQSLWSFFVVLILLQFTFWWPLFQYLQLLEFFSWPRPVWLPGGFPYPVFPVCRSVSWPEPSWSLWWTPFFADTHNQKVGHPGESQEVCVSILLRETHPDTTAVLFPTRERSAAASSSSQDQLFQTFSCKSKHQASSAHFSCPKQ